MSMEGIYREQIAICNKVDDGLKAWPTNVGRVPPRVAIHEDWAEI